MAPHKEDDQKDRKGAEETSSDAHHHVVEKSLRQHPDHIVCSRVKEPQVVGEKDFVKDGEIFCKIRGKESSKQDRHRQEDAKGDKVGPGDDAPPVPLQEYEQGDEHSRGGKEYPAQGQPAQEQVLYVRHVEAVLLVKEILGLSVHIRDDGELRPPPDEVIHHFLRHIHDVLHLHIETFRDIVLRIFPLVKPVVRVTVYGQLEAGEQKSQDKQEHSCHGQYMMQFFHKAILLSVVSFL